MELYQKQQFDFLLNTAVERFAERIEQRNQGSLQALKNLRQDPECEGVSLSQFVDALFRDFLLDNADGACFILRALAARRVAHSGSGTIEEALLSLARSSFAELLKQKTEEALEQRLVFQPVPPGA